jgi:hypothetical protein
MLEGTHTALPLQLLPCIQVQMLLLLLLLLLSIQFLYLYLPVSSSLPLQAPAHTQVQHSIPCRSRALCPRITRHPGCTRHGITTTDHSGDGMHTGYTVMPVDASWVRGSGGTGAADDCRLPNLEFYSGVNPLQMAAPALTSRDFLTTFR